MTDRGPTAAPGWYPVEGGQQRYWDGQQWTEHIMPAAPEAPRPGPTSAQGSPYGQAPIPGPPFGLDPQPGASAGQAPFATPQAGWSNASWQGPAQAQHGQALGPFDGTAYGPARSEDRSMAVLCHLLGLFLSILGPLIIKVVKGDESPYVSAQATEALNFQISIFLYWVATMFMSLILIGLLVMPFLLLFMLIAPILAAVGANKGENYQYPATIRFIT